MIQATIEERFSALMRCIGECEGRLAQLEDAIVRAECGGHDAAVALDALNIQRDSLTHLQKSRRVLARLLAAQNLA